MRSGVRGREHVAASVDENRSGGRLNPEGNWRTKVLFGIAASRKILVELSRFKLILATRPYLCYLHQNQPTNKEHLTQCPAPTLKHVLRR